MAKSPKESMRCGQVRKSTRPGKKIMKLYCIDGKRKLVHAGSTGYGHNYSAAARRSYLARSAGIKGKGGRSTKDDKFSANYWARKVLWAGPGGSKASNPRRKK